MLTPARTLPALSLAVLALVLAACASPARPGPPTPWRALSAAEEAVGRGDREGAIRTLRGLVAEHPDLLEPRRRLGRLLLATGSPDAAAVLGALGALGKQPDRRDLLDLVDAHLVRKDAEAAARFLRAYAVDPGPVAVRPYLLRARLDRLRGDDGAATRALEQALAVDPEHPEALEALIRLATDRGDTAARDDLLARLRRAHPGRPAPR